MNAKPENGADSPVPVDPQDLLQDLQGEAGCLTGDAQGKADSDIVSAEAGRGLTEDAAVMASGVVRGGGVAIPRRRNVIDRLKDSISGGGDPRAARYDVDVGNSHGVVIGDNASVTQHFHVENDVDADAARAREVFLRSLRHRDEFIGDFLKQALRQASWTYRFSMAFMTAGGIIVLAAGVMALTQDPGSAEQTIALASGVAGLLVGAAGAAFSRKSDLARKHLAEQAEKMHSQLLDERKLNEVSALLSGIRNDDANDRVRAMLALKLLSGGPESQSDTPEIGVAASGGSAEDQEPQGPSRRKKRRRSPK